MIHRLIEKEMRMYSNESLKLSAIKAIVFTSFFICFFVNANTNKHAELEATVKHYLIEQTASYNSEQIKINVRAIDERIEIPECAVPITASSNGLQQNQSNISVKLSCESNNWYLFTHATVAIVEKVVVSADNLNPGTLLAANNLKIVEIDKNKLRGPTFNRKEDIIGARVKRRMREGNIIDSRMLCYVCKGDRITIAALSGGLSLRVYGVALQDGTLGDTIQVKNTSSDKMVYGRVTSTSEVTVSI